MQAGGAPPAAAVGPLSEMEDVLLPNGGRLPLMGFGTFKVESAAAVRWGALCPVPRALCRSWASARTKVCTKVESATWGTLRTLQPSEAQVATACVGVSGRLQCTVTTTPPYPAVLLTVTAITPLVLGPHLMAM